ncbi:helix-hairpin-helix domain-containing protein [Lysinibacillus sp. 3P01SB]|uniref:helix-hairpin-helix domain-containing protein n=1 Tax=Lysinibacillus sp. 3P01SB TaxID=3132284 RepID=UPI0039A46F8D
MPSILCVAGVFVFVYMQREEQSSFELITEAEPVQAEPQTQLQQDAAEESEPLQVLVDVKGAVNYPGVYTLTEEDRVVDAITLAGGYIEEANPSLINHAQKLQDEMVIYIPQKGEEQEITIQDFTAVNNINDASDHGKVNINTADETQLTTLPGIGPAKAKAIISHREEQGAFQTIEGLKEVSGIGDKTFGQLKDLIDIK